MKYRSLVLLAISSSVSAKPLFPYPLEAYVDPIDRQIAETEKGLPGRPAPCARDEVINGIKVVVGQPIDKCVRMLPPQEWRGLWRFAFEGSQFCPEPATTCDLNTKGDKIFLLGGPGTRGRGELYRVDFIGRRTKYKASYNLVWDHEMILDQAIKIELISKPPMPPKATVEYLKKKCAANPSCDMRSVTETWRLEYQADAGSRGSNK
jgi:hypothetical protein